MKPDIHIVNWGHEDCKPNHQFGPTVRNHFLFHFVTKGEGTFTCKGKTYPIKAGQGFIIKPGELTFYQASGTDPWSYRWVGYNGTDALALTREAGLATANVFDASPISHIDSILAGIEDDITTFASLLPGEMCALGGLYRFLFKAGASRIKEQDDSESVRMQYFDKACLYLRANFERGVTIAQTAAFVGLSRSQLFRVFKQCADASPEEILLRLRLDRAKELLSQTNMSVKEIAISCGFSSTAHLCSQFKNRAGMTPGTYRENKLRINEKASN